MLQHLDIQKQEQHTEMSLMMTWGQGKDKFWNNSCQFRKHYKDWDTQSIPLMFPSAGQMWEELQRVQSMQPPGNQSLVFPCSSTYFISKKSLKIPPPASKKASHILNIFIAKLQSSCLKYQQSLIKICPSVLPITVGCPTYFLLQINPLNRGIRITLT